MGGGHYTASIKYTDGSWYYCNDSSISKTQESEVVCEEAYVLFYVRRGSLVLGNTVTETIKLDDVNLQLPNSKKLP